jgi:molybdopterin synthase catalytic subunit
LRVGEPAVTPTRLAVQTQMIDNPSAMALFIDSTAPADAGAVVAFQGVVRNHDGGRGVRELEYEAHPTAADVLQRAAHEVAARHPALSGLRIAHRSGLLQIGDCALYAEVCSPHRAEAFAACAELVDEVKHVLPVWKRQIFHDGTDEWVNCP